LLLAFHPYYLFVIFCSLVAERNDKTTRISLLNSILNLYIRIIDFIVCMNIRMSFFFQQVVVLEKTEDFFNFRFVFVLYEVFLTIDDCLGPFCP
jgi:hypothetical protein